MSTIQRLGQALKIKSGTRLRVIDQTIKEYVRSTPQAAVTLVSGSFDASQVVSGTFADARISESSVTQHRDAIVAAISATLVNAANDAAAAGAGVAVGEFYRNGSVVQVRVT